MILCRGDLNPFIEACQGLDRILADYVVNTWEEGVYKIHGSEIIFKVNYIVETTSLPNKGKEVRCNSKVSKLEELRKFEAGNFELKPY